MIYLKKLRVTDSRGTSVDIDFTHSKKRVLENGIEIMEIWKGERCLIWLSTYIPGIPEEGQLKIEEI